jgi:hypothetical protein
MNATPNAQPVVRYVHVAHGLLFDGATLTLLDLSPSTIWMSSTPNPRVGYVPTGDFLDLWEQRTDAAPSSRRFRATLGLLDRDAEGSGNATLLLSHPRVSGAGLAYDAQVVEGLVPTRSGACVVFLEWSTTQATQRLV